MGKRGRSIEEKSGRPSTRRDIDENGKGMKRERERRGEVEWIMQISDYLILSFILRFDSGKCKIIKG